METANTMYHTQISGRLTSCVVGMRLQKRLGLCSDGIGEQNTGLARTNQRSHSNYHPL